MTRRNERSRPPLPNEAAECMRAAKVYEAYLEESLRADARHTEEFASEEPMGLYPQLTTEESDAFRMGFEKDPSGIVEILQRGAATADFMRFLGEFIKHNGFSIRVEAKQKHFGMYRDALLELSIRDCLRKKYGPERASQLSALTAAIWSRDTDENFAEVLSDDSEVAQLHAELLARSAEFARARDKTHPLLMLRYKLEFRSNPVKKAPV